MLLPSTTALQHPPCPTHEGVVANWASPYRQVTACAFRIAHFCSCFDGLRGQIRSAISGDYVLLRCTGHLAVAKFFPTPFSVPYLPLAASGSRTPVPSPLASARRHLQRTSRPTYLSECLLTPAFTYCDPSLPSGLERRYLGRRSCPLHVSRRSKSNQPTRRTPLVVPARHLPNGHDALLLSRRLRLLVHLPQLLTKPPRHPFIRRLTLPYPSNHLWTAGGDGLCHVNAALLPSDLND